MPKGTPPKGKDTSALRADSRARSKSVKLKALSGDASVAAMEASRASSGESSPVRKASTKLQASPNHGASTRAEYPRLLAPFTVVVGSVQV